MPDCVIDSLPQLERDKVLDRILAGESSASIARSLGLHPTSVGKYRRRVVHPALRTAAQIATVQGSTHLSSQHSDLVRQVSNASPFKERLHALWSRIERVLDRAEDAVQVTRDGDAVAEDLQALAPLLNQAHKNLELLGKASGDLADKSAAPMVSIQIVVPANPSAAPRVAFGTGDGVIDVGFEDIGARL